MLEIYRLLVLLVSVLAWCVLAQMDTNSKIREGSGFKSKDICIPAKYRETAEEVLKNMKYEIEPCDDFYQFACGKFDESVQIPEGLQYLDAYVLIEETLVQQLEEIITDERPATDPIHLRLPNKLFKSCMDRTLIDSLVDLPVRQISNSLGGWPVVVGDSWDSDNTWSWQDLAKKLRRLGFSTDYIMSFSIENNVENKTRNIIYLDEPDCLFQSGINSTSRNLYYNFMVNAAISFGANKAAAIRELPKVLNFELDLMEISESDDNVNYVGNLLTIKQLQERYPYIQWLDFISALLPEGFTIDENEIINLFSPNFFDKLGDLLARTDNRTIANYIMWKFHYFSMKFLSQGFRNRRQQFDTLVLGTPPEEDMLNECVYLVLESLPISLSSLYAHQYFNQNSRSIVTEIFEKTRNVFGQTLDESQWLDDETRAEAKRKLHSMKAIIGFPDEVFDVGRMEEYHRELEIDENKYFQSYLNIRTFNLDKEFLALRMSANEIEFLRNTIPSVCNRFAYNLQRNVLRVPAAFLQEHLFNTERPHYMNYGAIGSIMAHEISHGFCGAGCEYSADGEKRDWWQPASMQTLTQKEKCLVEQYDNYTDKQTGRKINGLQTLEENIADNSGVKVSYLAYRQWQAINGDELRLPGLKYTPQQLFWISFAQSYCSKFTSDVMEYIIKRDTHSPNEFRVLGVLRNMKEFSRDFHCPENSPMNPVHKCEIW